MSQSEAICHDQSHSKAFAFLFPKGDLYVGRGSGHNHLVDGLLTNHFRKIQSQAQLRKSCVFEQIQ